MKFFGIFTILLAELFRGVFSGASILSLDSSSPIFKRAGENLTITAILRPSDFADYQIIEVVHRNLLTMEERLLGSLQDYITVLTSVYGYDVSVTDVSASRKDMDFFIESLSIQDDGVIAVHYKSTAGMINATVERFLTVVVSPESVKIKFGNLHAVEINSTEAIEVDSGSITVYCIVEESNPEITDISLTLNGDGVTLATGPDYERVSADENLHSSNVSAILEIPSNINETQTLTCVAVDYFGQSYSVVLLYDKNSAYAEKTQILGLVILLVVTFLTIR